MTNIGHELIKRLHKAMRRREGREVQQKQPTKQLGAAAFELRKKLYETRNNAQADQSEQRSPTASQNGSGSRDSE